MSPTDQANILLVLRYAMALIALWAVAAYLGRERLLSIWESEGVLSSRLIAGFITAMFGLALQYWALHTALNHAQIEMVEHCLDADFIFSGSLFGLGVSKIALSRFSPKPTVDPTQQPKPDEPEKAAAPPS